MPTFLITHGKAIFIAIVAFIIVSYVMILKHENNTLKRDNENLKVTIETTKVLGQQQNEKADRIEQGSRKAAEIITSQYTSDLQKVKDYYAKHPTIKPVIHTVSMCNTSSNSAEQVPSTNTSPSGTDEATAHTVFDRPSLAEECTVTTLMLLKLQEFETTQQAIQ